MVKNKITLDEFLDLLRSKQGDRTQLELARELDISQAYLSDVLRGYRLPGDSIARRLGFHRVIYFERSKDGKRKEA